GSRLLPSLEAAAQSFKRLSAGEARALRSKRIDVVTVQRGQSVAALAQRMNVDQEKEERFRVLNGLDTRQGLQAGQRVKLIR
ncbi:MAG: LysM peptidoglycan-binding domain-containing protein, partial [Pseudomonadota bacterium]